MKFYTGYFARGKVYENANLFVVSIALYSPKGTDFKKWANVMPDGRLLADYKAGRAGEDEYTKRYLAQLEKLDLLSELREIESQVPAGYNGIVFCCYEKIGGFCHRRILADYMQKKYGIEMPEYM